MLKTVTAFLVATVLSLLCLHPQTQAGETAGRRVKVLFLGDKGHHEPFARAMQLMPALAPRGVDIYYTEFLEDLSPRTLQHYDALMIYANLIQLAQEQEEALLQFITEGKGLVAVHCASACFGNSSRYIDLVGGRFKSHGVGVFRASIVAPDHALMRGFKGFESWDETYVHDRHNEKDRTVLEMRESEPWTWTRACGKGRVFYTAWGHDQRTWSNPGFHDLIERGTRWAAGDWALQANAVEKPFKYQPANVVFYAGSHKLGESWKQMQSPMPPEESAKRLIAPPEFDVRLFASEPDIVKPIAMAWDERGRLWIAETMDYPNDRQPEGQGRDRIKICEDTDGDGRADKFTVFADKLSIPTSLCFANGGVVVHQAPVTLLLKDTNGDDKADVRQVLLTGWGTGDTHAGPSNLRYGLDNHLWGIVGYSRFDGAVNGEKISFGAGFYRLKPDGSALEFVRSNNNNSWGLGFSEDGIVFGSTANNNPSVYMPLPNRTYEAVKGWSATVLSTMARSTQFAPATSKVRQVDAHGRYTAAAGHALYTARAFPQKYWNRAAFVCEPTGHLAGVFFIERKGADCSSYNAFNLLASDDEWTAPIAAEAGPDGAVWVIDWYNYIVQHNPTPAGFKNGRGNAYETELRDKEHGRIYRVVHKGAKPAQPLNLKDASSAQLVGALRNDNMLWRLHAQRLLIERGLRDAIPALMVLAADKQVDEIGLNPGVIHALWTLHGLGALDGSNAVAQKAALSALAHPSAGVRRNAAQVLSRNEASRDALLPLLKDADAQVRLAALLTLVETPRADHAGKAIFEALQDPANAGDRWITDAITAAAAAHDASFLKAALAKMTVAAGAVSEQAPATPIANGSFEAGKGAAPEHWHSVVYGGRAQHNLDAAGRSGRCVKISSTAGSDASWTFTAAVKPNTRYRLSGWVKTAGLKKNTGRGALFNVHEIQPEGISKAIAGDNDWTQLAVEFNSGNRRSLNINCLFGGWGQSTGQAWYDDIELVEISGSQSLLGPAGEVVSLVTRHFAERGPVESVVPTILALKQADPGLAGFILDGLAAGWPAGKAPELSAADSAALGELAAALPPAHAARLLLLAGKWGKTDLLRDHSGALAGKLRGQLESDSAGDPQRMDAARKLVALNDNAETAKAILDQITLKASPEVAAALVNALGESRDAATGAALVSRLNALPPAAQKAAAGVLLRRSAWTLELLKAIEVQKIARAALRLSDWQMLKQHEDAQVAALAGKIDASAGDADRQKIFAEFEPSLTLAGDAAKGAEVFQANCAQCHMINGKGGQVGPDLTGIGQRSARDILLEILDPNRSVEANFRMWLVKLNDGRVLNGRLDSETRTTIELLDLEGKKQVIQRDAIAKLSASPLSIMPVGLEKIGQQGMADLLKYLGESKTKH